MSAVFPSVIVIYCDICHSLISSEMSGYKVVAANNNIWILHTRTKQTHQIPILQIFLLKYQIIIFALMQLLAIRLPDNTENTIIV